MWLNVTPASSLSLIVSVTPANVSEPTPLADKMIVSSSSSMSSLTIVRSPDAEVSPTPIVNAPGRVKSSVMSAVPVSVKVRVTAETAG